MIAARATVARTRSWRGEQVFCRVFNAARAGSWCVRDACGKWPQRDQSVKIFAGG